MSMAKGNGIIKIKDVAAIIIIAAAISCIAIYAIGINCNIQGLFYSILLIAGYYYMRHKNIGLPLVGIHFDISRKQITMSAIAGLAIFVVMVLPFNIKAFISPYGADNIANSLSGKLPFLFSRFIVVIVISPLAEEVIFRGVLFRIINSKLDIVTSSVLTSTIFSIPHLLEPITINVALVIIYFFIGGMLFNFIYIKYKNVLASYICHSMFNACVFVMYLFYGKIA